jgi:hypothetical protein
LHFPLICAGIFFSVCFSLSGKMGEKRAESRKRERVGASAGG